MNKVKKLYLSMFIALFFVMLLSMCSYAEDFYYATTDMTYAEFYAGELGTTAEILSSDLDAISSATDHFDGSRFVQLVTSTDENGCNVIYGVKDVQVRMSEEVYNALTDDEKERYTFSDEIFDEYKEVATDGSFGVMVTETEELSDATVTVSSGASSTWGHYMLSITNESVDNIAIADYLGATVETSDGKIYGLRHLNNLWVRAREMAFVIDDSYSEPHGAIRYYAHTADLAGKTISKIRYILKNQPDLIINCEAYLPEITTASVKPQGGVVASGTNVSIQMIFSDVPDEASYTNVVSVYKGSGRSRTVLTTDQYNYSNGVLTIYATLSEGEEYHIVLSDANGKYSDIRADINVSETHYATTDMTYAEFYAGELGTTAETLSTDLDAISSATDHFDASRFVQLVTSTDENGCNVIYGVKDVQVKMSKTVYDALTDDEKSDNGRYTFSTSTFDEYKEVATDGSFGAMVTETEELSDATVRRCIHK